MGKMINKRDEKDLKSYACKCVISHKVTGRKLETVVTFNDRGIVEDMAGISFYQDWRIVEKLCTDYRDINSFMLDFHGNHWEHQVPVHISA